MGWIERLVKTSIFAIPLFEPLRRNGAAVSEFRLPDQLKRPLVALWFWSLHVATDIQPFAKT